MSEVELHLIDFLTGFCPSVVFIIAPKYLYHYLKQDVTLSPHKMLYLLWISSSPKDETLRVLTHPPSFCFLPLPGDIFEIVCFPLHPSWALISWVRLRSVVINFLRWDTRVIQSLNPSMYVNIFLHLYRWTISWKTIAFLGSSFLFL